MKIKSIVITLDPDPTNEYEMASGTVLTFFDGRWSADKPMISSYMSMCHEVWKVIRNFQANRAEYKRV